MKYMEFDCLKPDFQKFYQDFICNFKNDIEKICVIRRIRLTEDILQQLASEVYKMMEFEIARATRSGFMISKIRLELQILNNRRIQFLIRSLDQEGKLFFEDDNYCIRLFFPTSRFGGN